MIPILTCIGIAAALSAGLFHIALGRPITTMRYEELAARWDRLGYWMVGCLALAALCAIGAFVLP